MKHFTKPLSVVLLAMMLVLSLAGCQTSEPVDTVPEIVVPAPAAVTDAPAAETVADTSAPAVDTAAQTAAPEPAPAAQPVTEAAPQVVRQTGSLSFFGYTLTYDAVPGRADVSYPAFITDEEVDAELQQIAFERQIIEDALMPPVDSMPYPEGEQGPEEPAVDEVDEEIEADIEAMPIAEEEEVIVQE